MTEQIVNAPYKYTFPITKALVGDDGRRRLIGAATGPEIDLENQRVSKSLINKWCDQINNRTIQVAYDDNHKKDSESITAELGEIEKAWVDEQDHLMVQVLLDDDNPVAQYIHKSAMKGKQYGMSIFGKATRFIDELVSGKMVRTIIDGTLERVAHTTRPIWTPSLGTVLSKAVDEAAGDNNVSVEEKTETITVEKAEVEVKTESGAGINPETGKAPDESASAESAATTTVEKAVTTDTKTEAKALENIVKTYQTLGTQLKAAGLLPDEVAGSGQESTETKTVEKSETSESTADVAELKKSVSDLTALVTSIADRISDGTAPGSLRKSEEIDPISELRAVEDPLERMRLAFAASSVGSSTR